MLRQSYLLPSFVRRALVCWCGLWIAAGTTKAEVPVVDDYLLATWEVDEGLPVNAVQAIAQTPEGYLWLATGAGLVRFDGVRFTTFTRASGLESNRLSALLVSGNGELWIGLERGGVARLHRGKIESVLPLASPDSKTGFVTSLAEDSRGAIWMGFAGEKRVLRWTAGQVTIFGPEDGVGPGEETFVQADSAGRIWLATKAGCAVFDGSRFHPVDAETKEQAKLGMARSGGVWAANGSRLGRYSGDGNVEVVADLAWLGGSVEVRTLFEDDEGTLWVGSRGAGLYRFRKGKFERVPTSHDALQAVAQTGDGNLWAGTRGGGLNRLRPRQLFLRTKQHGLTKDSVAAIALDRNGVLWIAPVVGVPVRALTAKGGSFAPVPGWTDGAPIMACVPDPNAGVWFAFDGGGAVHWSADAIERISAAPRRLESLLPAADGSVWIAPRGAGVAQLKDGVYQAIDRPMALSSVRALGEDAEGRIWAGTLRGEVFRKEEGGLFAPVDLGDAQPARGIRFFLPDGPGTMWIGTESGLIRWRDGKAGRVTMANGLPENDIPQMAFDDVGYVWIATGRHLCRVKRSDLDAVLDGRASTLHPTIFRRDDGLPNVGFVSGSRHATERTPDGHIWMATDRGALEIVPQPERAAQPLPAVIIEDLRVAGKPVPIVETGLKLPSRSRQFEIRYTVPQFTSPDRLQFRYRLAGFDSEWIKVGGTRRATFTRLPPGDYRFEVAAREPSGDWEPSAASLSFVIVPAWSETIAVRVSAALLGAAALAWLVRFVVLRRVRARLRRLEQETALERERGRIARDMHDELGASLTRIALMSDLAAFEPTVEGVAGKRFAEIAKAARSVSSTLDQIVWTVNPRNDTVERLVGYVGEFASEFLESAGIPLKLELPPAAPDTPVAPDVRHEVLLGVKEALNNIVKYAAATRVNLSMGFAQGELLVEIADDGRGFDRGVVPASSNGLLNMEQRFSSLGGSAQIDSRPGAGTNVKFRIPLR